ncbi:hypothetical protein V8C37DRAFT_374442 [Trichoderma ceciliae]
MPGKRIVRVHSYDLELRAFMTARPQAPEPLPVKEGLTKAEKRLVDLMNRFSQNKYQDRNPAADADSWSQQQRAIATM